MTARILVVDDILANVKLLEARLQAEYFEVLTAFNGQEALDICASERVDVVLLDVMMPGMDGFEVCQRIKTNPDTQDIPVVMVTALDQPSDKLQGLDAGADDFLTKPVDDIALIARVKNLVRLKMLNDEMAMRASTSSRLGLSPMSDGQSIDQLETGRVLLVDDHPRSAARILQALAKAHDAYVEPDMHAALQRVTDNNFDLLVVSLSLSNADGLRLCSQVRSLDKIRHLPIIILVEPGDEARLMRGLEMGINDYLMRPIDRHEMLARIKTQIKRKRYSDFLRMRLEQSIEQAVTDPLTGLHNRRYMETHLHGLVHESITDGRPLSILIADIDYFKRINDTYGHDAGDLVLQEFSERFRMNIRGQDLACRMGGEEFVIIMPDTTLNVGYQIAERIRTCVAELPFTIGTGEQVSLTASVGIATIQARTDTQKTLLKRADNALYEAKHQGRNRVVMVAA